MFAVEKKMSGKRTVLSYHDNLDEAIVASNMFRGSKVRAVGADADAVAADAGGSAGPETSRGGGSGAQNGKHQAFRQANHASTNGGMSQGTNQNGFDTEEHVPDASPLPGAMHTNNFTVHVNPQSRDMIEAESSPGPGAAGYGPSIQEGTSAAGSSSGNPANNEQGIDTAVGGGHHAYGRSYDSLEENKTDVVRNGGQTQDQYTSPTGIARTSSLTSGVGNRLQSPPGIGLHDQARDMLDKAMDSFFDTVQRQIPEQFDPMRFIPAVCDMLCGPPFNLDPEVANACAREFCARKMQSYDRGTGADNDPMMPTGNPTDPQMSRDEPAPFPGRPTANPSSMSGDVGAEGCMREIHRLLSDYFGASSALPATDEPSDLPATGGRPTPGGHLTGLKSDRPLVGAHDRRVAQCGDDAGPGSSPKVTVVSSRPRAPRMTIDKVRAEMATDAAYTQDLSDKKIEGMVAAGLLSSMQGRALKSEMKRRKREQIAQDAAVEYARLVTFGK